ncbi:MAG: formylglycine-generating enzyme family protein [Prolixibacteraceae bacterium]|nr:formylglycine-generating enzyme family protein [Prolixibacteraceae bacterium]
MQKFLSFLIASFPILTISAQQVTNIKVTQESDKVVLTYDIASDKAGQTFDIKVECSADGGKTYSIVPQTITGDLKGITAGKTKRIVWDVLSERQELAGDQFVFQLVAKIKYEHSMPVEYGMVLVEGGTYQMGSTSGETDERPHQVALSSFYLCKTEVTQAQWVAIMGSNPSYFKGDNLPVEQVSWNDVQTFIQKLNQQTGMNYRLPTEGEWEFAAHPPTLTGSATEYSGRNNIGNVAWYIDNSDKKTHPVGQKMPNKLGLYDMSGNVWEWCSDWYGAYISEPQTNPTGPKTGTYRVIRGGGWYDSADHCSPANRGGDRPGGGGNVIGFRLACSL